MMNWLMCKVHKQILLNYNRLWWWSSENLIVVPKFIGIMLVLKISILGWIPFRGILELKCSCNRKKWKYISKKKLQNTAPNS